LGPGKKANKEGCWKVNIGKTGVNTVNHRRTDKEDEVGGSQEVRKKKFKTGVKKQVWE